VQLLQAFAPFLGGGVHDAYDRLFQGLLTGNTRIGAEERVALLVDNEAADLLSAAYAERYPGPAGRARAEAIAAAVRAASDQALQRATWLGEDTRAAARKQLEAMRLSIGSPDVALPLASLGFDRGDYVGNVLKLRRWRHAQSMARLASPVWPEPVSQTVPLVGFEAGQNRLIVTAAALQAPVLGGASDAADYGALGALLAQQMAQDLRRLQGSDAQAFNARVAPLLVQYGKAPGGAFGADGSRFLLQSAADVGGLDVAWQALNARGVPTDADKKAFFLAWAGLWARQGSEPIAATPDAVAYPPARWRANGPAMNHPAFATTFACKAGQPMAIAEADRVGLWR
jgi:putative endopeptidase